MTTGLDRLDTISGGGGTDSLAFKDSNDAANDLDGVSGISYVHH